MATKHDEKIKALELKLSQAKALRAKDEARARAAEAAAKRSAETRRKILTGAAVLAEIEHDLERSVWLNSVLARQLTRADDRALFGLAPLPASAPVPAVAQDAQISP